MNKQSRSSSEESPEALQAIDFERLGRSVTEHKAEAQGPAQAGYRQILSDAWQITWRYKYLWLFGFLAGLTLGGGDGSNSYLQVGTWFYQNAGNLWNVQGLAGVLTLAVALVFWLLGIVARGSLIHGVAGLDSPDQEPVGRVGGLLRTGLRFLPRILLMQLLIWSPILVLNITSSAVSQSVLETMPSGAETGNLDSSDFGVFGGLGLLVCGTALLTIPITFLDAFGYRAIVLEGMPATKGIRRAFAVVKGNLGRILVLALICLVLMVVFSLVLGLVLSPLLLVMMKPMVQGVTQCGQFLGNFQATSRCLQEMSADPLLVILSVVGSIISAALSSVWVTWQSAVFTVAYLRLTKAH